MQSIIGMMCGATGGLMQELMGRGVQLSHFLALEVSIVCVFVLGVHVVFTCVLLCRWFGRADIL